MRIYPVLLLAAAFLVAPCAHALTVDRVTSVMDDAGGSLSISTQSSSSAGTGESQTDLVASSFSPGGAGTVSGTIGRSGDRTTENLSAVYNGSATIAATNAEGEAVTLEIYLQDLAVLREGEGPDYSGLVTINGNEFDAANLPEHARQIVVRILRLFRFG